MTDKEILLEFDPFQMANDINQHIADSLTLIDNAITRLERAITGLPVLRQAITEVQKRSGNPGIDMADAVLQPQLNRLLSIRRDISTSYVTTPGYSRMLVEQLSSPNPISMRENAP